MTNYQRTKRLHTWAACGFVFVLFILVTIVGPSLA
jgi:hypothetical protein